MDETIARMIKESGEMWESVRDRTDSPVLITKSMVTHFPVWELSLEPGAHHPYWTVIERELTEEESEELKEAYHSRKIDQVGSIMGGVVEGTNFMVRAYVKNGRKPADMGWTVSTDRVKVVVERIHG